MIARALETNHELQRLDLSNNQLFPQGEVPHDKLVGDSFVAGAKVRIKEGYDGELTVLKEADAEGRVTIGDFTCIGAIADALRVTSSLTTVWTPAHEPILPLP